MTDDVALGPGREFDLVRALRVRWGTRARGLGDDSAVLTVPPGEQLVVSTDQSVERVHFLREWLSPREIGRRATTAALSDIAAMAAEPLGVLVALALPRTWLEHAEELADGIGDAIDEANTVVLGGDLSASEELVLALTVLGSAAHPLRRSGARVGDRIYVTGVLGGPGAAVRDWRAGVAPAIGARERFVHPRARLREARWLARAGAHAAIDISDGLLGDLAHLAAASGVRIVVDLDAIRTIAGVSPLAAARSGEEYELAIAAPAGLDVAAFERDFELALTAVGQVESGAPEVYAMLAGERVAGLGGFSHFS